MTNYVTREQLEARFGQSDVTNAAYRDSLDAGQVIAAAVTGAAELIDGYLLGGDYILPLVPVPALVSEIALDIVWYKLWRGPVDDTVAARYKDALRQLVDIQSGRIKLPGVAGAAIEADNSDTEVLLDCPDRPLSGNLGGW